MAVILAVDDEPLMLRLLRVVLDKAGFTVLTARGGEDAMAVYHSVNGAIDLLVTDVVMPDLDGPTLARRLRAARADLPVLFISGFVTECPTTESASAYRSYFLRKPFAPEVLMRAVEAMLRPAEKTGR